MHPNFSNRVPEKCTHNKLYAHPKWGIFGPPLLPTPRVIPHAGSGLQQGGHSRGLGVGASRPGQAAPSAHPKSCSHQLVIGGVVLEGAQHKFGQGRPAESGRVVHHDLLLVPCRSLAGPRWWVGGRGACPCWWLGFAGSSQLLCWGLLRLLLLPGLRAGHFGPDEPHQHLQEQGSQQHSPALGRGTETLCQGGHQSASLGSRELPPKTPRPLPHYTPHSSPPQHPARPPSSSVRPPEGSAGAIFTAQNRSSLERGGRGQDGTHRHTYRALLCLHMAPRGLKWPLASPAPHSILRIAVRLPRQPLPQLLTDQGALKPKPQISTGSKSHRWS